MKTGLVVVLGMLAAAASHGQALRFTEPRADAILRAGQQVPVRWSGLAPRAEEMELLLSLDDGRHFRVRLTPQMDGASDSFLWQVPELPGHGARLAMRARIAGRERVVGTSERFEIRAAQNAPAVPPRAVVAEREGELWQEEGSISMPAPGARGVRPVPPAPNLSEGGAETTATEPRTGAVAPPPSGFLSSRVALSSRRYDLDVSGPGDRRPVTSPLRN